MTNDKGLTIEKNSSDFLQPSRIMTKDHSDQRVLHYILNSNCWGRYSKLMGNFLQTKYADSLINALKELKCEELYVSELHGIGHIERTMLHGAMCAKAEDLSDDDTHLLLLMCAYHDTGRVDDRVDPLHGYRSSLNIARITGLSGDELRIAEAGVEAHSLNDWWMDAVIAKHFSSDLWRKPIFVRADRLSKMLKDADGLDRVRINDLDPNRLRWLDSRARVDFAQYLLDMYSDFTKNANTNTEIKKK